MHKSEAIFRFGPYELRPRTRELYKHGVRVRLRPQSFQVLHILLEHAGELVTREQLHRQLWPSDIFVDFEHGLNGAVKELKKDEALASLQKAFSDHSNILTALKVDPIYDPLRGDPRFQALLRRVRLAQ